MRFFNLDAWIVVACGFIACIVAVAEPPLPALTSADLLSDGIELLDGSRITMQPLVVTPDLAPSERQGKLAELGGRIDPGQFTRQSVQAPVMIQISPVKDERGNRIAHRIHTAFVAYAPFARLQDDELLKQIFGPAVDDRAAAEGAAEPADGQSKEIPLGVLEKLSVPQPRENERYQFVSFPLLNEVQVQGTLHVLRTDGADWIQLTWLLDPRFKDAGEFANRWSKETRDALGRSVRTEPLPYAGMAGQVMVSVTDPGSNQLLFESRMILHEPDDWFAGDNFLRAKLPLAIQENARNFRRDLMSQ